MLYMQLPKGGCIVLSMGGKWLLPDYGLPGLGAPRALQWVAGGRPERPRGTVARSR